MSDSVTTKSGLTFLVRPNSWDLNIIKELDAGTRFTYANLCTFNQEDVWIDAGGYIGTFACRFSPEVRQIYSFEPDPTNARLFRQHLVLNHIGDNVRLSQKALVANQDDTRSFYLSTKKSTAGHSSYIKGGREEIIVRCKNFDAAMIQLRPNKLKLDVEGEEKYILPLCSGWHDLDELVFEWHFGVNRDPSCSQYHEMIALVQQYFPHVCFYDAKPGAWIALVHASRDPQCHQHTEQGA